jgi:hypothetical protein
MYLPIMPQVKISNPGKLLAGILVFIDNRLVGEIRAGHYQGSKVVPQ